MKKLEFEKELGGDGAKASGSLGIVGDVVLAQVNISYPVIKIIDPATKALDSLLDKLEALIPGQWDKPVIEKLKVEYKEQLVELIAKV